MWWLSFVLQKIPIKCARVGQKNRDGTVGKPWTEIYFFLALFIHTWQRDLARILRPLVTFAEQIFKKIMNNQEYNELNLIISYVALLVSNGDWKPPRMGTYSAN